MTAIIYRGDRSNTGFFYRTLRQCIDRTEMAARVQSIVNQVDWSQTGPDGRTGRVRTVRGEIMLAVLTYCYALGLHRAMDIESALATGQVNVGAVEGAPVDRHALIRFRRHHRDLLTQCLSEILIQLDNSPAPRLSHDSATIALARAAAETRIDRAIEWDCIDRDE